MRAYDWRPDPQTHSAQSDHIATRVRVLRINKGSILVKVTGCHTRDIIGGPMIKITTGSRAVSLGDKLQIDPGEIYQPWRDLKRTHRVKDKRPAPARSQQRSSRDSGWSEAADTAEEHDGLIIRTFRAIFGSGGEDDDWD